MKMRIFVAIGVLCVCALIVVGQSRKRPKPSPSPVDTFSWDNFDGVSWSVVKHSGPVKAKVWDNTKTTFAARTLSWPGPVYPIR